jgi:hypothetical protein
MSQPYGGYRSTPLYKDRCTYFLIVYSEEIGLTDIQLKEISRLRLDYLCQYRDSYAQFIRMALAYENALRADDYEGIKKTIDKTLEIYRNIGHLFVSVHQSAYNMLLDSQFDVFRLYFDKIKNPEEITLLSGAPFTPTDMFTWHLTFADEIGLTESQVKRIKWLREQYHRKFLESYSQMSLLELKFEQVMAVKEIDIDLAFALIDQILDLYRELGYMYADLGKQLCEDILTGEQQARFRAAYIPMWEPIVNAWKEILEKGYMP